MNTKTQLKKCKLCEIASFIFMLITVIISLGASLLVLLSRNKFLDLYKDMKVMTPAARFFLSPLGNLSFAAFFIGMAVFLIIKESRILRKKTALTINIAALIIALIMFYIYGGGLLMPLFDIQRPSS